jgi:hypothetical protein
MAIEPVLDISPTMALRSVLLPAPLAPTMAHFVPGSTRQSIPFRMGAGPRKTETFSNSKAAPRASPRWNCRIVSVDTAEDDVEEETSVGAVDACNRNGLVGIGIWLHGENTGITNASQLPNNSNVKQLHIDEIMGILNEAAIDCLPRILRYLLQ